MPLDNYHSTVFKVYIDTFFLIFSVFSFFEVRNFWFQGPWPFSRQSKFQISTETNLFESRHPEFPYLGNQHTYIIDLKFPPYLQHTHTFP